MADHSDFVAMARELIEGDGRQITLAQLDATAADPAKPWKGPAAPTPINPVTVFAISVPVSSLVHLGIVVKDDDLFKQAQEVLIVEPPITNEDLTGYHIFCDGNVITGPNRRRITTAQVLRPGSTPIVYALGAIR